MRIEINWFYGGRKRQVQSGVCIRCRRVGNLQTVGVIVPKEEICKTEVGVTKKKPSFRGLWVRNNFSLNPFT